MKKEVGEGKKTSYCDLDGWKYRARISAVVFLTKDDFADGKEEILDGRDFAVAPNGTTRM